jgi:hypothetical protein
MLDILLIVLAVIAVAVVAILIIAATKPDTFAVERSTSIAAAPDSIFPLINDLRAHRAWSPFDQNPNMQRTYSGPSKGPGSALEFADRKAGTGRLDITDASQPSQITMRLRMTKPMKCDNVVKFSLVPRGGATDVTWAMSGPQPFIGKVLGTIINCDKMCGTQFEKGLADLKAVAENRIAPEGARERKQQTA